MKRCCWPGCIDLVRRSSELCETHAIKTYWLMHEEDPHRQPAAPKPRAKPTFETGVIYYVQVQGQIKVGWTSNLEQRLKSYAPDRVLLGMEIGTRQDETAIHRACKPFRVAGREWYDTSPGMLRMVEEGIDRGRQHVGLENLVQRDHGLPRRPGAPSRAVTFTG